jgi:hypothetical protein
MVLSFVIELLNYWQFRGDEQFLKAVVELQRLE